MSARFSPPAFPGPNDPDGAPGMSLRDWFAGQVAPMLMSQPVALRTTSEKLGITDAEAVARSSYEIADALLAERVQRR